MRRLLLAAMLALAAATSGLAQQLGAGSVTGSITDEQGAVLPGVTVTLTGSDRTLTTTTDSAGKYRFLNLAPGTYRVSLALTGFATAIQENVEVRVGANVELPTIRDEGRRGGGDRHRLG